MKQTRFKKQLTPKFALVLTFRDVEKYRVTMVEYARSRITIYRRYKRMLVALRLLEEGGVLAKDELEKKLALVEELYRDLKLERKRNRPKEARPVGRPRSQSEHQSERCKRPGCKNEPAKNQAYCSKECSPCGYYDALNSRSASAGRGR